ncbi:phosphoglycerate mutase (2,3-diphosphoglycerate-independent) [Candidatus Woesebacteria bacterium RBG_13_36_22]|uniref:2,3-bisphosphoglycerate-independent phosphoglycerate mutase n=1 Tax=Candidatus Woesebacteria bacterium RBG_13_36_22 TaxID=1802478 RepID=A0A1F7X5N1_9BACT|nr:MAG: phosphoglycerate mutase (2,3-diphosphoglycerate-independent) [Candidatus Woesebacteria bacterium RBG_13_36_22]
MSPDITPKFIILAILDGWGLAAEGPGNAIKIAQTPNINTFWSSYPHCELEASGEAVGLPRGEDGNTETGHLNLGAGKVVYQSLKRIDMSIADGSFFKKEVLINAINHAKSNNSKLHYIGLIGAGGVHSNIEHLFALIHLASQHSFKNVFLHLFTDGRDSPPTSAKTYIHDIKNVIENEKTGIIASIMGRYWAMDRDQRWDRTEKAYLALTQGNGIYVKNADEAIEIHYKKGVTDEFIEPSLISGKDGKPICLIGDNDSVVFFNFREDRPRQLTKVFILDDFSKANIIFDTEAFHQKYEIVQKEAPIERKEPFSRGRKLNNLYFVTMTQYSKALVKEGAIPAFPPEVIPTPLSMVISNAVMRQLKITESEKERFVTFYFNGLRETPFPLEERIIIPSPKIPTYDQKPEMSAFEMTELLLNKLSTSEYKLVVVNYPNADMVGHTGNLGATVKAVEVVDECIGKIANFVLAYKGLLLITSDHGNAEELININTGMIDTEHSNNMVPFIAVSNNLLGQSQTLHTGILADIAPTIISAFNLKPPERMTGRNLLADLKGESIS